MEENLWIVWLEMVESVIFVLDNSVNLNMKSKEIVTKKEEVRWIL